AAPSPPPPPATERSVGLAKRSSTGFARSAPSGFLVSFAALRHPRSALVGVWTAPRFLLVRGVVSPDRTSVGSSSSGPLACAARGGAPPAPSGDPRSRRSPAPRS